MDLLLHFQMKWMIYDCMSALKGSLSTNPSKRNGTLPFKFDPWKLYKPKRQTTIIVSNSKKYFTYSRVINAVAATPWTVGSQSIWDPTTHTVAAIAFITMLHVEYCSPFLTTLPNKRTKVQEIIRYLPSTKCRSKNAIDWIFCTCKPG